ncbi:MAG: CHC2 zinc finger domain-containing protein [archaeon]
MIGSNKYRYERVRTEIDGLMHISKDVKLKRVGALFTGLCPFHNEKTPSFRVYPTGYMNPYTKEKQDYVSFYCFGCDAGGDIIEYEKIKSNYEYRIQAVEDLEIEYGFSANNDEAQQSYLKEQLNKIKNSHGNILSLSEINLICSSICRNYLLWVKEYYPNNINKEYIIIEKFYKYFDYTLPNRNALEAMTLIDEVNEKINKRRMLMKEGKLYVNEKKDATK